MIRNCHPTINEFFFAEKVILVEGDTEQVVFSKLKKEDVTIVNCRGKANIPMFQKILNHFGIGYIVLHDLDSPAVKRQGKWIKNSMWNINSKILLEAQKGKDTKVIVSVPDFEMQFFGYLQSGDKPFNALKELNNPTLADSKEELKSIVDDSIDDTFERLIMNKDQYVALGKKYCEKYDIEMNEKWDFELAADEN